MFRLGSQAPVAIKPESFNEKAQKLQEYIFEQEEKKKLEAQNKELLLNKERLESALEDKLLNGKTPAKPAASNAHGKKA